MRQPVTLVGSVAALLRGAPAPMLDVADKAPVGVGLLADIWFTVAGAAGLALWTATREPAEVSRSLRSTQGQ